MHKNPSNAEKKAATAERRKVYMGFRKKEFEELIKKIGSPLLFRFDTLREAVAPTNQKAFFPYFHNLAKEQEYSVVRNPQAKDGRWRINGVRTSVYAENRHKFTNGEILNLAKKNTFLF